MLEEGSLGVFWQQWGSKVSKFSAVKTCEFLTLS